MSARPFDNGDVPRSRLEALRGPAAPDDPATVSPPQGDQAQGDQAQETQAAPADLLDPPSEVPPPPYATPPREPAKPVEPPPGYVPAPTDEPPPSGPLRALLERYGTGTGLATSLPTLDPDTRVRPATIGLVLVVCLALAAAVWWLLSGVRSGPEPVVDSDVEAALDSPDHPPDSAPTDSAPAPDSSPEDEVVVHVAGDVTDPGVITLTAGSRVADAIEAAGGLAEDADDEATDTVNLARPLIDGEQVAVGAEAQAAAGESGNDPDGDAPIDLNTATIEDLEELPGVGPVLAETIIEHRDDSDGFDDVSQLMDVRGIGEGRFADLEERVVVAGAE